jgi:hypothetical protein
MIFANGSFAGTQEYEYSGSTTQQSWVQAYWRYAAASGEAGGVPVRRMGTHHNGYPADGPLSAAY